MTPPRPAVPPLPVGFRIALDRGTRELAPGVWSGGTPTRVVRLTAAGSAVWRRLATDAVDSVPAGALARRLTDAGLAHPCPPPVTPGAADVTVVIPVRDRAGHLDSCLAAQERAYPVIVVDDSSRDPAAIAAVAAAHGATLHRRRVNGGPAAARNTGLEQVTTELVAFVDSDCVPDPGWIEALAGHFADPVVAAVAPRITAEESTVVGCAMTGLDLGGEPARVAPRTRLSYVPTAALVARRRALQAVARPSGVFDPALRVGEDVDLVWRLHEGGWRVRYDPTVRVGHREPTTWQALLARRMSYGTSAAPLALRHPESIPPLVVDPWPALAVAAVLCRRPVAAGAALAASVLTTARALRDHDLPTTDAPRMAASATAKTFLGLGRYATQFAAPLLLAGLLRRGHRVAALALLAGPGLAAWAARRPPLDSIRYVSAAIADDVAYGAGVWAGCLKHRTIAPLRPVIRWPARKRERSP
jgi:mycofactocin glycosyltransferase